MLEKVVNAVKSLSPKNTVSKKPESKEIAVAGIEDRYSDYPSNGLTPQKLANIFREADSGDVWRQMELFEEMEEKDLHLFSQLQTRKNTVTGLDFEIIPFGDTELDRRIAEFVEEQIDSIESIEDIFIDLLDAIGKGISVSEIMWAYDDGYYIVDEIKWRHQKKFFWDTEDKLKVRTKDEPNGIELPDNKFIVHRYKARSGHPSRAGILRVAAWMYLFKNYDIKDWVSFCEVYGMPLRLGKYNPSASEEDKIALMQALVELGTDAAGIIPDNTEIEFKESAKNTSINVYESLARFCDEQMSKAILGQTLTSDSGGGSYAQSKTHNEVRHDLTVADCKALASTLRRDLLKPLVYFNFGEDRRIPTIRFDTEEAEDLKELAEVYDTLINKFGVKIALSHIYKKFSIPKPEEGEEVTSSEAERAEQLQLKAYKGELDEGQRVNRKYQGKVDDLVDKSVESSQEVFTEMFKPILELMDEVDSLEELQKILQNQESVNELYESMSSEKMEELIHKTMFYADLLGRVKENERSI